MTNKLKIFVKAEKFNVSLSFIHVCLLYILRHMCVSWHVYLHELSFFSVLFSFKHILYAIDWQTDWYTDWYTGINWRVEHFDPRNTSQGHYGTCQMQTVSTQISLHNCINWAMSPFICYKLFRLYKLSTQTGQSTELQSMCWSVRALAVSTCDRVHFCKISPKHNRIIHLGLTHSFIQRS